MNSLGNTPKESTAAAENCRNSYNYGNCYCARKHQNALMTNPFCIQMSSRGSPVAEAALRLLPLFERWWFHCNLWLSRSQWSAPSAALQHMQTALPHREEHPRRVKFWTDLRQQPDAHLERPIQLCTRTDPRGFQAGGPPAHTRSEPRSSNRVEV